MRTVYKNHDRFVETYFSTYPGRYFSGDGARRDEDGYYWITGRVDDVLNVSGHRLGTAEVESAMVRHPRVSEAAVVGYPHDIKGQGIYVYVTLNHGENPAMSCVKSCANGCVRKLVLLPPRIRFSGHRVYPRLAPAKLCAGFCARLPRTIMPNWAILRPWQIRRWWMS